MTTFTVIGRLAAVAFAILAIAFLLSGQEKKRGAMLSTGSGLTITSTTPVWARDDSFGPRYELRAGVLTADDKEIPLSPEVKRAFMALLHALDSQYHAAIPTQALQWRDVKQPELNEKK